MRKASLKYQTMSPDEKNELIEKLLDKIEELEKKLEQHEKPKKTSKNLSLPPSQTQKGSIKRQAKGKRVAHRQGGRVLSEQPDEVIVAKVKQCAYCQQGLAEGAQKLSLVYEKIDLPVVKPYVCRIERYEATCPCCQQVTQAPVPQGLEAGSPFGKRIQHLALYYRYAHIISYQRLSQMFAEVFGLEISEGGLGNLLKRSQGELTPDVKAILQRLQRSRLVASDETGARVSGKNQWEWVFQNEDVCLHVIRPSRGYDVIHEVMQEHQPEIWVSDLFSAQAKHPAKAWQVCLAHQLRDCQYAIDAGDERFAPRMKRLLLRAFVIHSKRQQLTEAKLEHYRQKLLRSLQLYLTLVPDNAEGKRLKKRYLKIKDSLFLFLEDNTIPPTNNSSEQALRMSKVFRKVTNCFRSDWGRDLFADMRSIINTGKRHNQNALQAIAAALDPKRSIFDSS
jgi:transposase